MSNFKYKMKGDKLYLSIGDDRILILWKERWVPSSEIIITEPVVEDGELEVSSIDIVDDGTLVINSDEIELVNNHQLSIKGVIYDLHDSRIPDVDASNAGEYLQVDENGDLILG